MTTVKKKDGGTTHCATDATTSSRETPEANAGSTRRHPGRVSRGTVTADLEEPIPLLGRRAQHLGHVGKLVLSLEDRSIRQVELTTPWQTLQLHGATVAFDERRGVFRLRRRDQSAGGRGKAQSSPSSAS